MNIPVPAKFGEVADCKGKKLICSGVGWFKWSTGWEWTYFFETGDIWHKNDFYISKVQEQPYCYTIADSYLEDKPVKEHGYPLKGTGYMTGLSMRNGLLYADFIMTSNYLTHIKIQCNDRGEYIENGDIIFPPSWDTKAKRENAKLKQYRFITEKPVEEVKEESHQISIFEYMHMASS